MDGDMRGHREVTIPIIKREAYTFYTNKYINVGFCNTIKYTKKCHSYNSCFGKAKSFFAQFSFSISARAKSY